MISKQKLSLLGLGIEILSPSMSSQIGDSRCNNSTCKAQGFDCCLSNQCINDGEIKPGASSYADYNQALHDVSSNPKSKYLYPHIYYICPNYPQSVPSTPTSGGNDNLEEAQENLKRDIKFYECLEEGKKETPDFATNNVCNPADSYLSSLCSGKNYDGCHQEIRSSVWKRCGCKADPLSNLS